MSLTIQQKNQALVSLFAKSKFTSNDVMTVLMRSGVPAATVEVEAQALLQEWHDSDRIRQIATDVWRKKPA